MTCGAGGYLAHRSICKTPLKVLSKALVKLGKSKMLGDVGSRISPSGCVEFLGKTFSKHLQMLNVVNFRNRFWQNNLDQTSCWIILDHRINIHQWSHPGLVGGCQPQTAKVVDLNGLLHPLPGRLPGYPATESMQRSERFEHVLRILELYGVML